MILFSCVLLSTNPLKNKIFHLTCLDLYNYNKYPESVPDVMSHSQDWNGHEVTVTFDL